MTSMEMELSLIKAAGAIKSVSMQLAQEGENRQAQTITCIALTLDVIEEHLLQLSEESRRLEDTTDMPEPFKAHHLGGDPIDTALYLMTRAHKLSHAVYGIATLMETNQDGLDQAQVHAIAAALDSAQSDFDSECREHAESFEEFKAMTAAAVQKKAA